MQKLPKQFDRAVRIGIRRGALCLIGGSLAAMPLLVGAAAESPSPSQAPTVSMNGIPLSFEANAGQAADEVQFLAHGPSYSIGLTDAGAELSLAAAIKQNSEAPAMLRLEVEGSNATRPPVAEDPLPGRVNYFIGTDPAKWRTDVKTYGKVRYSAVYPGVDLVYYGTNGQLEYDFAVAPGAKANPIRLGFHGADHLRVDAKGNLLISMSGRELVFKRPVAYQMDSGERTEVAAAYRISGRSVRFNVGSYDHSKALIIDPVLSYLSYLGGSGNDTIGPQEASGGFLPDNGYAISGQAAAVDAAGDFFVAGYTLSTNFPSKAPFAPPATKTDSRSAWAFVTKLAPDAKSLVFSTYLGGSQDDRVRGIAVDQSGNVFAVGTTSSNDFPVTSGAYQKLCSPTGTGQGTVVANCSDPGNNGSAGAFVTKLSASGALLASTFLSGSYGAQAYAVALDAMGRPYVAGFAYPGVTQSQAADHNQSLGFPTTAGAVVTAYGPVPDVNGSLQLDAFVSIFDPTLSTLMYSTLLGDAQSYVEGIAVADTIGTSVIVDKAGNFYLAGFTSDAYLPGTSGSYQPSISTCGPLQSNAKILNGTCGFVAKFSSIGGSSAPTLTYATYLGDLPHNGSTNISGIAADAAGDAYVVGYTDLAGFPTTAGAYQATCDRYPASGNYDCSAAFIAKLSPNGKTLLASTYFGDYNSGYNNISDQINNTGPILVDSFGNVYIAGTAAENLPQINPLGTSNAPAAYSPFVAELDPNLTTLKFSTLLATGEPGQIVVAGMAMDAHGDVYVAGNMSPPNSSAATPGVFQPAFGGGADGFVAKLMPHTVTALGVQADFLGTAKAGFAVWRPSTGEWYVIDGAGRSATHPFGVSTDLPVIGDFDGDGKSDLAVYRPSTGYWYITQSGSGEVVAKQFGASTDIPVSGDFDGDGKTDLAVYRPSTGYWYIEQSTNGDVVAKPFGVSTDTPVVGDFDGDGKTDLAVFRPSTGYWYITQSSNGAVVAKQWGASTDIPVTGDFDGDGKTDIAVYRPSTGYWYIIQSSNGEVVATHWGQSGDIPVARDYDGDGKTDIAVFRPSTGYWYVIQSSNAAVVTQQWGASTDIPVNNLTR